MAKRASWAWASLQLRELVHSLGWSQRQLAAALGEHPTVVSRWSLDQKEIPDSVMLWLIKINAPLLHQCTPPASSTPGDMTGAELQRIRTTMGWSEVHLADRLGCGVTRVGNLLAGEHLDLSQGEAGWLRSVSAPLVQHPRPEGWQANFQASPEGTVTMMPDSPRQQHRESLRAEAAVQAEKACLRAEERRQRRAQAAALYLQPGATYQQVGRDMGISHQAVMKLVLAHFKEHPIKA